MPHSAEPELWPVRLKIRTLALHLVAYWWRLRVSGVESDPQIYGGGRIRYG